MKVASKFFSKEICKDAIDICKDVLRTDIRDKRRVTMPKIEFVGDILDNVTGKAVKYPVSQMAEVAWSSTCMMTFWLLLS